jgi:hypothetical protein
MHVNLIAREGIWLRLREAGTRKIIFWRNDPKLHENNGYKWM